MALAAFKNDVEVTRRNYSCYVIREELLRPRRMPEEGF